MENLVCHPDAAKHVESLPAATRMEFKRLIYYLSRSQFDRLEHCRPIDRIVNTALEIRIPLADPESFVFFYVRVDERDVVFFTFTATLKELYLAPELVDLAQNNHIEVMDSLDAEKGRR